MERKQQRNVVAANDGTARDLAKMSADLHGHLTTTALRANHGHLAGHQGGMEMPDSDAHKQANSFMPQKVMAAARETSQGSFQTGGASGNAEYETTNEGAVGDSDSGNPTGY